MSIGRVGNGVVGDRSIVVVGLGCQRGCATGELRQLMEVCLREYRFELRHISALASIDGKSEEPGLLELAEQLQVPVGFFSASELQAYEHALSHRSSIAFERTGCYGVAESAALAMAGRLSGSPPALIIPRRKSSQATFALASGRLVHT